MMNKLALLIIAMSAASHSSFSAAANIGICSSELERHDDMSVREFYSANGEPQLLVVSDSDLDSSMCESALLPQPTSAILWSSLLTSELNLDAYSQIILQGSFSAERADISEIITPEVTPAIETETEADAPTQQLGGLEDYNSLLFGIEERAQWIEGTQLDCSEGTEVAGIQLKANSLWPANRRLQINASGIGDFQIAIANEQHIANEATVSLGALQLNGNANNRTYHFTVPDTPLAWQAITILCPLNAATLHINSISLTPAVSDPSNHPRGAWVWNPATWQNTPHFFWTLQNLESINEFYITVPVNPAGEVANPQQLSAFVQQANARNIRIWAVIGDRHDVLPESLTILQTRIAAYRRYNTRVDATEKLAGVQLDIEPYLLPGHQLAKDLWRDRYLQTVSAAVQTAGESLHVDLVMPVWWGTHENWGPKLLNALSLPGISLTIMNYRTDYEQLLTGMPPFLEWGLENQQQVRMALETGSLSDETQRSYRRNIETGELWQLQIGATPILVLFDQPQQGLVGDSFNFGFERVFSADKLTFRGDQLRLNETAERLSEELSFWSSFAGIALHGLDEVYADQNQ
ncbi:MAG: hypothetical protein ACSHXZ_09520 [Gammaproteobacteria bacterium]